MSLPSPWCPTPPIPRKKILEKCLWVWGRREAEAKINGQTCDSTTKLPQYVAQNLERPVSVSDGRSIMLRFGSRQASRNSAKKLRRRMKEIAGGADTSYIAVTGDEPALVPLPLSPAGAEFNLGSSCGDAALLKEPPGWHWWTVRVSRLEPSPSTRIWRRLRTYAGIVDQRGFP